MATLLVCLAFVVLLSFVDSLSPYDVSKVQIKRESSSVGNGLIAKQPIKQNEIVVSVPLATCISSHRCGAIRGLAGQTDFSFDLFGDMRECVSEEDELRGRTWDVNLAVALLMATCGENLAASGAFWDSYRGAFPPPDMVSVPFCLPEALLKELQDDPMKVNALAQKQRIRSILASGKSPAPEGFEDALLWAFAMVRSRCFQVAEDWFSMVPIIDIANHDFVPTAKFEIVRAPSPTEDQDDEENALFAHGVCILRATRDMAEGDPVTISYGGGTAGYSNERLLVQYGFTLSENPIVSDSFLPQISEAEKVAYSSYQMSDRDENAVVDAAARLFADGGGLTPRVQRVSPILGKQLRVLPISALYQKVKAKLAEYPTTLAEDYELCRRAESDDAADSTQLLACLRYRIDVKENLTVAELILKYALDILKDS